MRGGSAPVATDPSVRERGGRVDAPGAMRASARSALRSGAHTQARVVPALHAHRAMRARPEHLLGAVSDFTIGTVIVLVHAALAQRKPSRPRAVELDRASLRDGTRVWRSQISP